MQPERKILKLERHPPTPSKTAIPKQKRDSKGTHQFHGINSFHIPAADVNGNRQYSALERKLIAAYRIVLLRRHYEFCCAANGVRRYHHGTVTS